MIINVWLILRDDAQAAIVTRLRWDEETQGPYTGPVTDRQNKLFSYMSDHGVKQGLWRSPTLAGRQWKLWSIDFDLPGNVMQQVRVELDQLTSDYPNSVIMTGAWSWDDGRQIGTQLTYATRIVTKTWSVLNPDYQPDDQEPDFDDRFVLRVTGDVEEEYISGSVGTPIYPMHAQILKLMPDDELGNPATELSNVNLGMGQALRSFI